VVDEFSAVSLAVFIASISSAGFSTSPSVKSPALYFWYSSSSLITAHLLEIGCAPLFPKAKISTGGKRRVLIVGAGSLGQRILTQIESHTLQP
jgi:FlaA1/EpsC-like NDP-sugar epimerase